MPQTFRIAALVLKLGALSLGALALPATLASTGTAFAQAGDEQGAPQQVALTQKQIDGLIAAQAEMSKLQAAAQQGDGQAPDPKLQAKVEAIAKKNGFAGLEQYEAVTASVGLVMGGIDPQTKSYVGPAAVIKKQIAQVQADKSMPAKDKKQALQELKEAMANSGAVKPQAGNIDIVSKNFDKLNQAFQGSGGGD